MQDEKLKEPASSKALQTQSKQTRHELTATEERDQNEVAITAIATKARAEVETAIMMARKFPRNEADARIAILKTCGMYSFAEKAKYRKPQGKKKVGNNWEQQFVVGPSIRLAEEMFRNFGGMTFETAVLYEGPTSRMIGCRAMDLQTLATTNAQFIVEKTVERKNSYGRNVISERVNSDNEIIYLVEATEDEVLSKQNNIGSKYRRNLILQLIPTYILQDAIERIDQTMLAGIKENPDKAKTMVTDNFAKIGVKPSDLEKFMGKPIAQFLAADILELKDLYQAITEGESTFNEAMEEKTGITDATIKPADEPLKGQFAAGDAVNHASVTAKVDKPVPATTITAPEGAKDPALKAKIMELEAMIDDVGKKRFNECLGWHGYATTFDIKTVVEAEKVIEEVKKLK